MTLVYLPVRRRLNKLCSSVVLALLAIMAESCATVSPGKSETAFSPAVVVPSVKQITNKQIAKPSKTKILQQGLASWYGREFSGKQTAGGDSFDEAKLTAAHKTFPLGSRVKVTNLRNGKAVEVEITDRGPFVDGRVIDVSEAAAHKMGIIASGTAPVQVELLSANPQR